MVRHKNRYLLCEVIVTDQRSLLSLDDRAVQNAVKGAVSMAHGDYGAALYHSAAFNVKYMNAHTGIVFLRCRKSNYRVLWSALPFITNLMARGQNVPCFLNCIHVGGTIRTCQKFLVRYNTRQLHRMLPNCQSEEERLEVRKAILRCSVSDLKGIPYKDEDGAESGEDDADDDDDDDDGEECGEDEEE